MIVDASAMLAIVLDEQDAPVPAEAIERRLSEVERTREVEVERRKERLLALGRAVAATLPPDHGATSTDHDALLYDEEGLPK